MPRRHPSIHALVAVSLMAVVFAACGGGSGSATEAPQAGATDEPAAGASNVPAAPAPGGGGDLPTVPDAPYATGSAHVEYSGDGQQGTIDAQLAPGTGITLNGFTSLMYLDPADAGSSIQIVLDPDVGGTLSLTSGTLVAAGGRAEGCTFEVTTADASGVAGSFSCQDIAGFADGGSQAVKLDATGTFEAAT